MYLVAKLSQVWGLLCEDGSRSSIGAFLQQTQDGVQAAPRTPQHTCNTPARSQSDSTAIRATTAGIRIGGVTWVLQVGGRHGFLDFVAQEVERQVGRLQLQGGDEKVQDVDLGFVTDPRHLLLRFRV